jgi:hypothetical protein
MALAQNLVNLHAHMRAAASHWRTLLTKALGHEDAANELRWITEHASKQKLSQAATADMVVRRASGEPLQYILGA